MSVPDWVSYVSAGVAGVSAGAAVWQSAVASIQARRAHQSAERAEEIEQATLRARREAVAAAQEAARQLADIQAIHRAVADASQQMADTLRAIESRETTPWEVLRSGEETLVLVNTSGRAARQVTTTTDSPFDPTEDLGDIGPSESRPFWYVPTWDCCEYLVTVSWLDEMGEPRQWRGVIPR